MVGKIIGSTLVAVFMICIVGYWIFAVEELTRTFICSLAILSMVMIFKT